MHFNFIDVILVYYGHQHVSASHLVIFRVNSLRTKKKVFKMFLDHSTMLKTIQFLVKIRIPHHIILHIVQKHGF